MPDLPPTKESGSVARVIAEQFLEPLSSTPGEQIRQTLARAYLDIEAERDALREALNLALMHLEDPRAVAAVRAAMERPE